MSSFIEKYEKDYVILTSDRILLNSKEDSIFVTSKKTIGFSAVEQVHFNIGPFGTKEGKDPSKYFLIVNSPSIQLGLPEDGSNQPVAKANSTIDCIKEIITQLQLLCESLKSSVAVGGVVSKIPDLNITADTVYKKLENIRNKYTNSDSPIKSKISKTI